MKVLLLTQIVVYPAHSGPGMKTLQVLRYLALFHHIVYCTFVRNDSERQYASMLRTLCTRVETVLLRRSGFRDAGFLATSLIQNDSFILRRDERDEMRAKVSQLLHEEHIDVLYVDQLNMMRAVPDEWNGPRLLDAHNALWQVVERLSREARNPFKRWLLKRETGLLRRLEGEACLRADIVLAVSEHDKQALCEVAGPAVPIQLVPITIDAAQFTSQNRSPQRGRMLTIGTLYWPPNSEGLEWWLRYGYERLCRLYAGVEHDIVGARPPPALQRLAKRLPGVHLHGYVADASPFWYRASMLAVPLLTGGGVRVKILEAMAMGVPVVSTSIGCEGLDVQHGIHLLVADTPDAFAAACANVLKDEKLADVLAHNARELVQRRYNAQIALKKLGGIMAILEANIAPGMHDVMNTE